MISHCHQYRARPACISMSGQLQIFIFYPQILIMYCPKKVRWTSPFKKFRKLSLILLESKMIILIYKYRAWPACTTRLYTFGLPNSSSYLDIPKMIIVCSKTGRWTKSIYEIQQVKIIIKFQHLYKLSSGKCTSTLMTLLKLLVIHDLHLFCLEQTNFT